MVPRASAHLPVVMAMASVGWRLSYLVSSFTVTLVCIADPALGLVLVTTMVLPLTEATPPCTFGPPNGAGAPGGGPSAPGRGGVWGYAGRWRTAGWCVGGALVVLGGTDQYPLRGDVVGICAGRRQYAHAAADHHIGKLSRPHLGEFGHGVEVDICGAAVGRSHLHGVPAYRRDEPAGPVMPAGVTCHRGRSRAGG